MPDKSKSKAINIKFSNFVYFINFGERNEGSRKGTHMKHADF